MKYSTVTQISKRIYELFVVNTAAAGIQQSNGAYLTKYIPVTPTLIENMIRSYGSMGCYQQGMNTGYIKWICFDFDCKNKETPDVVNLDRNIVSQLTNILDKRRIFYVKEFSGRRGIHVWVLFNCIIKKSTGYYIANEILNETNLKQFMDDTWGLDLFPATDSSKGNKVGKQVKFPLSAHKVGGRSFFYEGNFSKKEDFKSEDFYIDQLRILNCCRQNNIIDIINELGLTEHYQKEYKLKYKRFKIFGQIEIGTKDVIDILSETKVFRGIFKRMRTGQSLPQDWTVLMGTLSCCDDKAELLKGLFGEFPNYDIRVTEHYLNKLKDRYFPATLGYLYHIYDIPVEDGINTEITGLEYLVDRLGIGDKISEEILSRNENKIIHNISDTIKKEQDYMLYNDEAIDIYIWNALDLFKNLDAKHIQDKYINAIETGSFQEQITGVRCYKRIESDIKTRVLVSLSAEDRTLTTHLALKLYSLYGKQWKSYSYRPMLTSRKDIFYAWYMSWSNYITQIQSFIEVPFFYDYEIMYIDLKGFYDHIDFLTVYRTLGEQGNIEINNILHYLLGYNDKLMSYLNKGNRIGVPQGPAYARIIAELFLSEVLDIVTEKNRDYIHIYRYVDDIVIICDPGTDSTAIYNDVCKSLERYGLPINEEKSGCFGIIGGLNKYQREALLHTDSFNYDLRSGTQDGFMLANEKEANLNHYLNDNDFDIKSLGYIFSESTLPEAKRWCFESYREEIFSSTRGRGINFRRFYEYILTHDEYLMQTLEEELLSLIPTDSLNFSNFIDVLYIIIQRGMMPRQAFQNIQEEYLVKLDQDALDGNDRAVLRALLLIDLEGSADE